MRELVARYFIKTETIIKDQGKPKIVTMQFFQRANHVVLCGINEVLDLIKVHTNFPSFKVKYLSEGTIINGGDVVLELEGYYQDFGWLEGIIDGILARQSSLATNAYLLRQAAGSKSLIFMGDRADHYVNQINDGYAISVGGIDLQVTEAQVKKHHGQAVGTVPHVLIQMFNGDLVAALKAYQKAFPTEKLTALVDFHNDVIGDSLKALAAFGKDLSAVRVDTSPSMVDISMAPENLPGVHPLLITRLRQALDEQGGQHVKIIVSSGFDVAKVAAFEAAKVPVDIYGVGGSLLKINLNFTCDAVKLDGKPIAKAGRGYRPMRDFKVLT